MRGYLSDKDYSFIYGKSTRVCVDLLIVEAGEVLMVKRDTEPYKGKWHLPGGRIRFRETIKNAIKRIAKDEIGINVFVPKLAGYMEFLREMQGGKKRHTVSFVFQVSINGFPQKGKFCDLVNNILPVHRKFLTENKYL